ncbi:MAG: NAD(P)/FAD-dependent oxidoreductase [Desulforhopalus sp.]
MTIDVLIIGGGPGGLACAERTAAHGLRTLIIERKAVIGPKVCAGGITWNGLIKTVPGNLAERKFSRQYIYTRLQKVCVSSNTPIIATVNRQKLGQAMAEKARHAGVRIHTNCQVTQIRDQNVSYVDKATQEIHTVSFRYLVGCDGSSSLVRRYLGLPTVAKGIGINYQLKGDYSDMEWHLDSKLFGNGYAWIFPHKDSVSIGAYCSQKVLGAKPLHDNLIRWGRSKGFQLSSCKPRSELINFDYRGHRFNNIYLVGDAAGLASGLTGEGIYSAIVSGESVADSIINPACRASEMNRLIRNHSRHKKMAALAGKNKLLGSLLAELVTFCLKKRIFNFSVAEMAR